jgi:hypothetical protein
MTDTQPINDEAMDRMTVAPGDPQEAEAIHHPRQDAGQDKSISKRLEKNPESEEAQLDNALDESMDASDPPSNTQPGLGQDLPKSSGYDEEAERQKDA